MELPLDFFVRKCKIEIFGSKNTSFPMSHFSFFFSRLVYSIFLCILGVNFIFYQRFAVLLRKLLRDLLANLVHSLSSWHLSFSVLWKLRPLPTAIIDWELKICLSNEFSKNLTSCSIWFATNKNPKYREYISLNYSLHFNFFFIWMKNETAEIIQWQILLKVTDQLFYCGYCEISVNTKF